MKRSFGNFVTRLRDVGLYDAIEKRALASHVSLQALYNGDRTASVCAARRSVYLWLLKKKSVNEIARLFDRAPSGIHRMTRPS